MFIKGQISCPLSPHGGVSCASQNRTMLLEFVARGGVVRICLGNWLCEFLETGGNEVEGRRPRSVNRVARSPEMKKQLLGRTVRKFFGKNAFDGKVIEVVKQSVDRRLYH